MSDLKIEKQPARPASMGDGEVGSDKAVLSKDEQHLATLGYKQGTYRHICTS